MIMCTKDYVANGIALVYDNVYKIFRQLMKRVAENIPATEKGPEWARSRAFLVTKPILNSMGENAT